MIIYLLLNENVNVILNRFCLNLPGMNSNRMRIYDALSSTLQHVYNVDFQLEMEGNILR